MNFFYMNYNCLFSILLQAVTVGVRAAKNNGTEIYNEIM